jgi:CRP/FNR family cyclic AMP-dependent transcriptional regulator
VLTDSELIRKIDFFEPLDNKIIKDIAKTCIAREFALGDCVIKQGESELGLCFITSGRAKVEIERNGLRIVVADLRGGDFFGELSIINEHVRSGDVICTEETRCLLLTRDSFSKLLNKHPEIALQMAKSLAVRIRATAATPPPAVVSAPTVPQPVTDVDSPPRNGSSRSILSMLSPRNLPSFKSLLESCAGTLEEANVLKMYSSTKAKTKDFLVDIFKPIYLMKEMTRFSVAIVGCPVEVCPENPNEEILQARVEGVRIFIYPAAATQILQINAYGDGDFSTAVFRPCSDRHPWPRNLFRFTGKVSKGDMLRLYIPAATHDDEVLLTGSKRFSGDPAETCLSPIPEGSHPALDTHSDVLLDRSRTFN